MVPTTVYVINEDTHRVDEITLTGPQQAVVAAYQGDVLDVLREFYQGALPAFLAAGIPQAAVAMIIGEMITELIEDHDLSTTDTLAPVDWAGRTFGELTPDEQARASRTAGDQISRELTS